MCFMKRHAFTTDRSGCPVRPKSKLPALFQPLFLALLAAATAPAGERYNAGVNILEPSVKVSSNPFVNLAHAALPWRARGSRELWTDVDVLGYPRSLPPEGLYSMAISHHHPAGRYILTWKGSGEVRLDMPESGSAGLLEESPGKRVYDVEPASYGSIVIMSQDPADRVRDIRLTGPDGTDRDAVWNPAFVREVSRFRVLRFPRLMPMVTGPEGTPWGREGQYTFTAIPKEWPQVGRGLPVPWLIELVNQTGVEPWICVPDGMDAAGCRTLAEQFAAGVKGSGAVYVEWGNEQLSRNGRNEPDRMKPEAAEYLRQTAQVADIWRDLFGPRLRVVLSLEESDLARIDALADALQKFPQTESFDLIAVSPYFGVGLGAELPSPLDGVTPDQIFDVIEKKIRPRVRADLEAAAALAQTHGLGLAAYSGGQHISTYRGAFARSDEPAMGPLIAAAARHPGMETLYRHLLEDWQAVGGTIFVFTDLVSNAHHVGQWGLIEHLGVSGEEAPKLRGIRPLLERDNTVRD